MSRRTAGKAVLARIASVRLSIGRRVTMVKAAVRRQGLAGAARKIVRFLRRDARYQQWIASYDTCGAGERAMLEAETRRLPRSPLISIVVPVYNTPASLLAEMIESVLAQIYPHWELCLADDASPEPHVRDILQRYSAGDSRIRVAYRERNGHICEASNSALDLATGEFIALLDHDDVLPCHALAVVARYINTYREAKLFYSDEDKISEAGRRSTPYFKADWDPELILQQNFFSHLGVFDTNIVREVGGFRRGLEGSQDHDLVLRCARIVAPSQIVHIPHVLYHWRTIEGSTAVSIAEKPYAVDAYVRAVAEHLVATGVDATIVPPSRDFPFIRIDHALPDPLPRVHVVVLSGDNRDADMVTYLSDLLSKTAYTNLHVTLVKRNAGLSLPDELARTVSVAGARDGSDIERMLDGHDMVCVIDARAMPIEPDWLRRLVGHAMQPGVGLAGPVLFDAAGSLRAAGQVMASPTRAVPALPGDGVGDFGYFGWQVLTRVVSSIPAACVVAKVDRVRAAGGLRFDPERAWNVDLSMRMMAGGMRNLIVPRVAFCDMSRGQRQFVDDVVVEEAAAVRESRYSPNLSLTDSAAEFDYAYPPRVTAFS
ncbi:glycosyltransferase [Burkholderia pseudomultivorans]|uniref:glycosyltransferase n=1 Tax=Burkholderia pseudomultivorans TaxID=1207504 RepID=UPI002876C482|nr:glycosyltransferase [Burkholderia pseudomultivorans]MDS0862839.1 glycosyltransferase [Burkholderia pseudomultivorans]